MMSSHTLGPFGKATVILFTAQFDSELPKLSDLKRLLHIPDEAVIEDSGWQVLPKPRPPLGSLQQAGDFDVHRSKSNRK